jgi:hypothetical protein
MQATNAAATTDAKDWPKSRSIFPTGQLLPFFLVTALLFLWGIANNLNDVLIRQFPAPAGGITVVAAHALLGAEAEVPARIRVRAQRFRHSL